MSKPKPLGTCDKYPIPHVKNATGMNDCVNWRESPQAEARARICNCLHTVDNHSRHHDGPGACLRPMCGCLGFITVSAGTAREFFSWYAAPDKRAELNKWMIGRIPAQVFEDVMSFAEAYAAKLRQERDVLGDPYRNKLWKQDIEARERAESELGEARAALKQRDLQIADLKRNQKGIRGS